MSITTYQDLLKVGTNEAERMEFVFSEISKHKNSSEYRTAQTANLYYTKRNKTINEFVKILYTVSGKAIPDNISANYKLASGFFRRFVTQQVEYLLANGVGFSDDHKDKLGKGFDRQIQEAARKACVCGCSFVFYNLDHIEVFDYMDFKPLFDEESSVLRGGIYFTQFAADKPITALLFEEDGYTRYRNDGGTYSVTESKKKYVLSYKGTEFDGLLLDNAKNYSGFPIVPLYANPEHLSEIVGIQEGIDCYDLIKSGFANTIDEASIIYWTLKNAGGMDDLDMTKFVERLKTVHAYACDDGEEATPHSIAVPTEGRLQLLSLISADLYRDYMALDTERIASGALTATQIKAAYEGLNSKADLFEYQVGDCIESILELAGIEDTFSFTRSQNLNVTEMVQTIASAAQFLPTEYATKKIIDILGDGDKAEEIIKQMEAENLARMGVNLNNGAVED